MCVLSRDPRQAGAQVFVFFLAFATPLFGNVSPQLAWLPLTLTALAAGALLALHPHTAAPVASLLRNPQWILVLPFLIYITLQSSRYHGNMVGLQDIQRPLLIGFFLVALAYICLLRGDVLKLPIPAVFIAGLMMALAVFFVVMAYHFVLQQFVPASSANGLAKDIRSINRYLEVLAVLVLLAPAALHGRSQGLALILVGATYLATFIVVGHWTATDAIVHVASDTVQMGIPIALCVYLLARVLPILATRLVFAAIAGLLAFAPWLYTLLWQVGPSIVPFRRNLILDRVEIWYGTVRRVLDGSWFEFIFGRGREFLRRDGDFMLDGRYATYMPDHPHNMVLQLWLDMGLVGVMFVLAFLWPFYRWIAAAEEAQRPGLLAALTMITLVACVSHSLWQIWWQAAILSVLLLMLALARPAAAAAMTIPAGSGSDRED